MRCFRRCDWSIRLVSFIPACDPLPSPYKLVFEFLFRFWRCTGREKLAKKCWIDDNLATALVHNSIRALSLSRSKTFGYPVRAVGAVNLYHRPGRTCLSESGTAVCIRDHSLALFLFLFFLLFIFFFFLFIYELSSFGAASIATPEFPDMIGTSFVRIKNAARLY